MSDLAKHIEILLLDNDCVIVPGFGGFMAHRVDSMYVEEEDIFLPPSRTLGFNPQLHVNDSLLAQSYVEAFDISYPEALRQIENEVQEVKRMLSNEGRFELPDIGELSINEDGKYIFTPCTAGILTPNLYALNSFEMPKLKTMANVEATTSSSAKNDTTSKKAKNLETISAIEAVQTVDENKKHDGAVKLLALNTDLIRTVAAVAVILLVLVFGILPVGDSSKANQQLCTIDTSLLQKMMPQMRTTSNEEIKPVKVINNAIVETGHEKTAPETKETKTKSENSFVVVLASGVSRKNAEIFINSLENYNIEDARLINKGTINHIVCGDFSSREDANIKANEMRNSASQFADVWVMETKN